MTIDDVKYKVNKFVRENRETIIAALPVLGTLTIAGVKILGKRRNLKLEEKLKDRRWYDPRLGHYWELRRKPNQWECLEIDRRQANGERLSDILSSMNLLKR